MTSPSGLRAEINANGSLRRLDCDAIALSLFVGNEVEGGPTNLYLRRHSEKIEWTPLLGPLSPTRFHTDPASGTLVGTGTWLGINYALTLVLAQSKPAWFWHVRLENTGSTPQQVDLTYAQDVALASYGAIRLNEFYVSQYLDHTPLQHAKHGVMVATTAESGRRRPLSLESDRLPARRQLVRHRREAIPRTRDPCRRSAGRARRRAARHGVCSTSTPWW